MSTPNRTDQHPRIAVVTCITCGMDTLHEPVVQSLHCDYFCFYDKNKPPEHVNRSRWRLVPAKYHPRIPQLRKNGKLLAKWYKMQAHKIRFIQKYSYILWVDGSIKIKNMHFVRTMISNTSNSICLFKHPWRDCIYKEYEQVKAKEECSRDNVLANQIRHYVGQRYPANNGLYCGTIVGRYKSEKANRVMDSWWEQMLTFSMRDQISLPFVLWKNRIKPDIVKGNVYNNRYFDKCRHTAYYYYCYRKEK